MNLPGLEASEFHDGFCLVMRNEVQDMGGGTHAVVTKDKSIQKKKVKQFKFKAWVSGPQEICVIAPLLTWSDRGNDDEIIRDFYKTEQPRLMTALDTSRNDYIKRMGVDTYETAHKVFVLRVMDADDLRVKLDGSVLLCNKKAKKQQPMEPGLLVPIPLNVSTNISSVDETLQEIDIADPNNASGKKRVKIWQVALVPRIVWQVANLATQARRVGRMEEDVDDPDDEDLIAKEMAKKCNIRTG
jgi:hypothetical protein